MASPQQIRVRVRAQRQIRALTRTLRGMIASRWRLQG
jgi:hypothetical protein